MIVLNQDIEEITSEYAEIMEALQSISGVKKSTNISAGNKYLKTILYQCGVSVCRSNNPTFLEFYDRISNWGSKKKAITTRTHKVLRIVYKILSEQTN